MVRKRPLRAIERCFGLLPPSPRSRPPKGPRRAFLDPVVHVVMTRERFTFLTLHTCNPCAISVQHRVEERGSDRDSSWNIVHRQTPLHATSFVELGPTGDLWNTRTFSAAPPRLAAFAKHPSSDPHPLHGQGLGSFVRDVLPETHRCLRRRRQFKRDGFEPGASRANRTHLRVVPTLHSSIAP